MDSKLMPPDKITKVSEEDYEAEMWMNAEQMADFRRVQEALSKKFGRAVSAREVMKLTLEAYLSEYDPMRR